MARNKYLLIVFLLSTAFFLWQHQFVSWDFASYASNAEYWKGGSYYEVSRPPLVPAMLFIFGEYAFIILASALFLYSGMRVADKMKIDRLLFYLFSLSPMVLFYGLLNGTELVSLALLELFFVYLMEKKPNGNALKAPAIAGVFLGLAFLARYNFLIFLPLAFSTRYPKKILATLALFAITLVPWLAFNYITTGNMLTSLADSYALNFKYRYYFEQPSSVTHALTAISLLLPLFAAGLYSVIRYRKPKDFKTIKFLCREKADILLIAIFALSLYQYISTPSKELRYLFPAALPVAYFSVRGIELFRKRTGIFLAVMLITLNIAFFASMNLGYETKGKYQNAIGVLHENNLSNCRLLSNAWPIMNYLGQTSEPFPRKELVARSIEEGNIVIFFPAITEPEWVQNREFISQYPATYESNDIIILGTGCNPPERYEHNYMLLLRDKIEAVHNVSINTNPCFVMFSGNELMERNCNLANGKGFTMDKNREDGLLLVRD